MPPQLEKNHVVPTAWQDEALARDGVSRATKHQLTFELKTDRKKKKKHNRVYEVKSILKYKGSIWKEWLLTVLKLAKN